jgi:serine phosphatase RsbU (regulator of sigma subunit)
MNENDEQYGWERLIDSVRQTPGLSISDTVHRIITGLAGFTDIEKLHDDATIIGIEVL